MEQKSHLSPLRRVFLYALFLSIFLLQSCLSSILDEIKKVDAIDEVITNTSHSIPLVYSDLRASRFFRGMDKEAFKTIGGEMFITSSVNINTDNRYSPYDLTQGQTDYSYQFDYSPKYSQRARDSIARRATFFGTERDTSEFAIPVSYRDMNILDSLWQISTSIKVKVEIPYTALEGSIAVFFESIKGRNSRRVARDSVTFTIGSEAKEKDMVFFNQVFTPVKADKPYLRVKLISRLSFQGQQNMHGTPFRITISLNSENVIKMFGKIKKKSFEFPARYKIDFTTLKESIQRIKNVFDVDFSHPYLKLEMSSNYGVNTAIDLKQIKVYNGGMASPLTGFPSTVPLRLTFLSNDQGVLIDKEEVFSNSNSNVNTILKNIPDSIVMVVAGEVYPASEEFQKENFASDQILRAKLEVRFPFRAFWRQVNYNVTTNYRPITEDKNVQATIDSVKLFTTVSNELPVQVQMSILLLDSMRNVSIKILESQLVDPAEVDEATGRGLSSRVATFFTNVSGADIDVYKKVRYINVISVLNQSNNSSPVYLEPDQTIDISLKSSFFLKSLKI